MPVDPGFKTTIGKVHATVGAALRNLQDKPEFFAFVPRAKPAAPNLKLTEPAPLLLHAKATPIKQAGVAELAGKVLKTEIQAPPLVVCGTVRRSAKGPLLFIADKSASKGTLEPVSLGKLLRKLVAELPVLKGAGLVVGPVTAEAEQVALAEGEAEEAAIPEAPSTSGAEVAAPEERGPDPEARYSTIATEVRTALGGAGTLANEDRVEVINAVKRAKVLADGDQYAEAVALLERVLALLTSRARAQQVKQEVEARGGPSLQQLSKARLIWIAARKEAKKELDKLGAAVKNDADLAEDPVLLKRAAKYMSGLDRALSTYDARLVDALDEVTNARDEAEKSEAIAKSRDIAKGYKDRIGREKILTEVDENPFVNVSVYATLRKSIEGISALLA